VPEPVEESATGAGGRRVGGGGRWSWLSGAGARRVEEADPCRRAVAACERGGWATAGGTVRTRWRAR
jgi:hypothetical protein